MASIVRLPSTSKDSKGGSLAIGLLLIPLGLLMTYFIFLKPALNVIHARRWAATPCTVTDSRIGRSHSRHGGTNYRVEVEFSYQYDGRHYDSDNYQFDKSYSSGYALKDAVVDRYPPGQRTTCYVNPENPGEAVIMRDFNPGLLLGLCPLAFSLAGILLIRRAVRTDTPQPPTPRQNSIVLGVFGLITGAVAGCVLFFQVIPEARLGTYEWNLYVLAGAFSIVALALVWKSISGLLKGG